jgi:hypothetical protein
LSVGGGFLIKLWVIIAKEAAEETTVILNDGIGRPRKTVGVKTVTVWAKVLFVPWIVYQEGI